MIEKKEDKDEKGGFGENIEDSFQKNGMPTFLDGYLFQVGLNLGLEPRGLEKSSDQFNLIDNLENDKSSFDQNSVEYLELKRIYLSNDYKKLESYDSKLPMTYKRDLELQNRNVIQASSFIKFARQKPTFGIVGAAHLVGERNVLSILKKKGYSVRRVRKGKPNNEIHNVYKSSNDTEWTTVISQKFPFQFLSMSNLPPKSFQGIGEINISSNISRGVIYLMMALPSFLANPEVIENGLVSEMLNDQETEINLMVDTDSLRIINFSGIVNDLPSRFQITMTESYSAIQIVIGFSETSLNFSGVSTFFQGLQPTINEYKLDPWIKRRSESGDFYFNFPKNIEIIETNSPMEGFEERGKIKIYYGVYQDPKSKDIYVVRYNGLLPGVTYLKPLDALKQQTEILANNQKARIEEYFTLIEKKVPTAYAVLRKEGGTFVFVKNMVKGSRSFMLIQNSESNQRDSAFFKSSGFTDSLQIGLEPFSYEPFGMNILMLPNEFREDPVQKMNMTETAYAFNSDQIGIDARISFTSFGKYNHLDVEDFQYSKDDLLLTERDSIYTLETGLHEGICPYFDVTFEEDSTFVLTRVKSFICNNHETSIKVSAPPALFKNEVINQIFNSIDLSIDSLSTLKITESKAHRLLEDLLSEDTLIYNKAEQSIFNYKGFREVDFDDLLRAISKEYPSEEVNKQLIDRLYELDFDPEMSQKLKIVYGQSNNEILKRFWIENESYKGDSLHFDRLFYFLENSKDGQSIEIYNLFGELKDSLELIEKFYKPIKTLVNRDIARDNALFLLSQWFYVDTAFQGLKDDKLWFEEKVRQGVDQYLSEAKEGEYIANYLDTYLTHCISCYRVKELEVKLIKNQEEYTLFILIENKLKKKEKVNKQLIEASLNSYLAYNVHSIYANYNKSLPKKWRAAPEVAKALFNTMSYEYNDFWVENVSIHESFKTEMNPSETLYLIKGKLRGSEEMIIGLVGPFVNGEYQSEASKIVFDKIQEGVSIKEYKDKLSAWILEYY
ncbi:TraB/GumN family protein [Jiulongibacter sp. NS-SX5]|uniref:TraB/GumN family protein n=1 Tax=Jiulongibacter sp. NS-SX5 TaxID=3463854 RepID=UPI004058EB99